MSDKINTPVRGRGELIAAALKRAQAAKPGTSEESSATEIPKLRGRAAILEQLKLKASAFGEPSTEETKKTEATKSLSQLQISDEVCNYKGESGTVVPASANYVILKAQLDQGVFEYEVKFDPDIDSKSVRAKVVYQIISELGLTKTFDGHSLYLPKQIFENTKTYKVIHPFSEDNITVTIIYKRRKRLTECVQLYNILFKRIMRILSYLRVGRQFFDKSKPFLVPQHKLEIWPGYVVAVHEYAGGLMLCLDVQHRVLRTENALQLILDITNKNPSNYKRCVENAIVGSSVLTRYNNNSYVIHDIAWDMHPESSFETRNGNKLIFSEYYKKQYDVDIKEKRQPMLVNRQTFNVLNQIEKEERLIMLVPELCYMTGLTDEMRSDFRIMKDIAQYTRVTPNQRMNSLRTFVNNVNHSAEAKEVLSGWGLAIDSATVDLQMRVLQPEIILFGNDVRFHGTTQADWTSAAMKNPVLHSVNINNWLLIFTNRDRRQADDFVQSVLRHGPKMGIKIAPPEKYCAPDDRTESYIRILEEKIVHSLQLVCIICPSLREERYSTIKKICCVKSPIPSQVILARTLKNPSKLPAVTQKIILQMNCKLGGSLWSLRFPFKKWMICGIDVHHSAAMTSKATCALVTSLNEAISKWYSSCCFHASDREIGDHLRPLFTKALMEFREYNSSYPTTVIIYRDGVGDGDMNTVNQYEVPQFLSAARDMGLDIKLIYIIVQKRISSRIFLRQAHDLGNPDPGSIVDHTITKKAFYDFFLIAQQVRQGTVTPTHYTVLFDNSNIKPDNIQRLTYKLCHMYYNWTGTIRVPAPCQYAHKLAFLTGQYIHAQASKTLENRLFYL